MATPTKENNATTYTFPPSSDEDEDVDVMSGINISEIQGTAFQGLHELGVFSSPRRAPPRWSYDSD
jgi:hypothetical protein